MIVAKKNEKTVGILKVLLDPIKRELLFLLVFLIALTTAELSFIRCSPRIPTYAKTRHRQTHTYRHSHTDRHRHSHTDRQTFTHRQT